MHVAMEVWPNARLRQNLAFALPRHLGPNCSPLLQLHGSLGHSGASTMVIKLSNVHSISFLGWFLVLNAIGTVLFLLTLLSCSCMQAAAACSLWVDEIVNMDETNVAFFGWFWSLVSCISPCGTPAASDSVILLLTVQLFSLLPHCQRSDTRGGRGGCGGRSPWSTVHPPKWKRRWQAPNSWGHLASFSIQGGNSCCKNFGLSWHVLLLASS